MAPVSIDVAHSPWSAPAGGAYALVVDVPRAGRLEARVDWTLAENDVDVYVSDGDCPSLEALVVGRCRVIVAADGIASKPERPSAVVAGGRVWVWIFNLGPGDEGGNVEVSLTP